jgi:hypothetical protein
MKEKIKNLLLIIWAIISLKIIWLTIGNVINLFWGFVLKFIDPVIPMKTFWLYIQTSFIDLLRPELGDDGLLLLLRGTLDLLLFYFIISSWILYFVLNKNWNKESVKIKNLINMFILSCILAIFLWLMSDIFISSFLNKPVTGLENTFFLFILRSLMLSTCILNILSVVCFFVGKDWHIFKKSILSFILLSITFYCCGFLDVLIIWNQGLLYEVLYNSDKSYLIENIIQTLYASYGFKHIIWCNPNEVAEPCEHLRQRMYEKCGWPNTVGKLPLYTRNLTGTFIGQGLYPASIVMSDCINLQVALEQCMHLHSEAIHRYMEAQQTLKTTITPHVGIQVIDTWSAYVKK